VSIGRGEGRCDEQLALTTTERHDYDVGPLTTDGVVVAAGGMSD
jgi:hypothetical protein